MNREMSEIDKLNAKARIREYQRNYQREYMKTRHKANNSTESVRQSKREWKKRNQDKRAEQGKRRTDKEPFHTVQQYRAWFPEDDVFVLSAVSEGWTIRQIASEIGRSVRAVIERRRILHAHHSPGTANGVRGTDGNEGRE